MRTSVADIVRETAAKHGLSVTLILSKDSRRALAWPRQEAMYRVFTECPHISYPEAGRRLGGRDHTTILHGVKAHCKRNGVDYADAVKMRLSGGVSPYFHQLMAAYGSAMKQGGSFAAAA
tara:strand:- start:342 stop:701 length:360 start_codon:yes stop_codon:yes gene_type:complete